MNRDAPEQTEIIFAWHYVEWGGVQIYFLGLMREALRRGYRIKAVMPRGSHEKLLGYLTAEKVPVEFFDARLDLSKAETIWHKARRKLRDARCFWVLGRHLGKQKLENKIVQIDIGAWSGWRVLYYLARRTHVFTTLHIAAAPYNERSPRDRLTKLKFHTLCRLPRFHLLASNEDMKESLRGFVPEDYRREIPIAYTGVNSAEIKNILAEPLDRAALLEKYDLPANKLLIFSLANIIERKGFRVLVEAARILRDAGHTDLFFVWLGDGEGRAEMEKLRRGFDLENSIKIIPPAAFGAERPDILRLLRLADVFVHPSYAEGLPGALLEAMALEKPVIASRINAIPEAVRAGENGLLVAAGDAAGFAAAIKTLADDADLREKLAANAHRRVLSDFTEENCGAVTLDFYEKFISRS